MRTNRLSGMELVALILGLVLLAMTAQGASAPDRPITAAGVSSWQITGERENGRCYTYAIALQLRLQEAGIPARIVGAYWKGKATGHAVVLFWIGGKCFLIDNERDQAMPVTGKSDLKRVRCYNRSIARVESSPETALSGTEMVLFMGGLMPAVTE